MVFFMETLSTKTHMEWLRVKVGFAWVFVVDPVGHSWGLALLWRDMDAIEI